MTTVFLTGASGFVGSHALRHILTNTDWDIVCPVTFRHRGIPARLALALDSIPGAKERVRTILLDLTGPIDPVTTKQIGPVDYILNFASESHVDRSITEPASFIRNNVELITGLLDWTRLNHPELKAFVQISTDEVYGPAEPGYAHREWEDIHLPSNPYSASKAAQEAICFSYWRTYDLPIILTNTMNIIGETQDPEKFFPKVLRSVLNGKKVPIHASSEGTIGSRFYLHARNQADGVLYAMNYALDCPDQSIEAVRYSQGGDKPWRFHIVGEREVNNLQLAFMIAGAASKRLRYQFEDFHSSRPGHDLRYALDGEKMEAIGWKPPVLLEDSVQKTVEWTIAHPEWI